MTPALATLAYRRQLGRHGEDVTLRRVNASPASPTEATVRARVTGYAPDELVGGVQQGDRKVVVLAEDVAAAGFPEPIQPGGRDKIVVRDRVLNVEAVDDNTRRVDGVLIAYELTVRG